jgi:hypothetical protein
MLLKLLTLPAQVTCYDVEIYVIQAERVNTDDFETLTELCGYDVNQHAD